MDVLDVARGIEADFPSSAGRPFRKPDPELLERRHELAAAARELPADVAAELGARAWRLWMAARDVDGGRAFLADVLERRDAPRSRWRALALYGDGLFAFWQDDAETSQRLNEEALAIAAECDDAEASALAHLGLSRALLERGDWERAYAHARQARELARPFGEAMSQATLHMEAQATRLAGDYDGAAKLFEESLALNRRIDDASMVPVEQHNLGHVELRRGNVDAAERYFAEVGSWPLNDAALAYAHGDVERARELLGQVDDGELATDDRRERDWLRERLQCAAT